MNNISNLFVPYELAKELKEKGFDEECLAYYHASNNELIINNLSNYQLEKNNLGIAAPLYQQVIDFLRNKYNINLHIEDAWDTKDKLKVVYLPVLSHNLYEQEPEDNEYFDDYYEAMIYNIKDALILI